ncbi:MAG: VOC family protein [Alphaproteobacteria bacterium]
MYKPGFHHLAFACRDIHETHRFYTEILGFDLLHTETKQMGTGYFRHIFFDIGDGSCLAFFDLHGVGEPETLKTEISTGLGLPPWVNHLAFRADKARKMEVAEKLKAAGKKIMMEIDHDWVQSMYFMDPNGIMLELCEDTPGIVVDREEAVRQMDFVPESVNA